MADIDLGYAFTLPPEEAIKFFESKGYLVNFDWRGIKAETHAKAFTVSGVTKVDILQDLKQALADTLRQGKTLEQFKDDLIPTLKRKGWFGGQRIVDQDTGEITGKQLTARRLKTIFQTNIQSAYNAGRFATQMQQVDTRPYWEYVAILDNRTRPAHRALSGEVYRYDHPFWSTFYPPNGYNCRCRVRTLTAAEARIENPTNDTGGGKLETIEQPVGKDKTQEAIGFRSGRTGELVAPDPGFGGNPGRDWQRPFTPPPMDTLPRSIPHGTALPDLPMPVASVARPLLPEGLLPEQYAKAFLQSFGADVGKPVTYKDVTGESLLINEWLFQDSAGRWKADKTNRGRYMELLAQAVMDPDEIWLAWLEYGGQHVLRRRYIKALESPEGDWGLAVFEEGKDGWTGSTVFPPKIGKSAQAKRDYIDAQRGSFLRWRKQQT